MTMQERDDIRSLQDRVILKLEGMGIAEEAKIIDGITLADLRMCIYPQHIDLFRQFA